MTVAQMRQRLHELYPTTGWQNKVKRMSDQQVVAIHIRLTLKGILK